MLRHCVAEHILQINRSNKEETSTPETDSDEKAPLTEDYIPP